MQEVCFVELLLYHANGTGVVRDGVDEDEGSSRSVLLVGVEEECLGRRYLHLTYLVEFEVFAFEVFHRVDVDAIVYGTDGGSGGIRVCFEEELLAAVHWFFVHPNEF